MRKHYETPLMYMEAFECAQYVAASNCGTHITSVPSHGHVQVKGSSEIHCAFTSSNCGLSATCECKDCDEVVGEHNVITQGTNLKASTPKSGHNCHILDNHDDAVYFAENYTDSKCGNGVAELLGAKGFSDIATAWS